MICWECSMNCITEYRIYVFCSLDRWVVTPNSEDKILAVRKACLNCEWTSHPTKIPESLVSHNDEQE